MWLTNSSIGRKLIMSVTGACLILFLTFHVLMNAVAIVWPTAYNTICALLGANWYALVASMGLAALFVIHIVYAFILTLQNRKARGNDRYNVTTLPPHVEWSSNNMLVLGIVVVAFLAVHMIQFWAKMQLIEALSHDPATWALVDGAAANPAAGTLFLHAAFSEIWTPIVYIIGFVALWFHMNHGFWSMFQTAGWNNDTWLPRLKKISLVWTSVVVGLFTIQAVWFTIQAKNDTYLNDTELQAQYWENIEESLTQLEADANDELTELNISVMNGSIKQADAMKKETELRKKYKELSDTYINAAKVFCKDIPTVKGIVFQEQMMQKMMQEQAAQQATAQGIAPEGTLVEPAEANTETNK